MPAGTKSPVPVLLTAGPPLVLALSFPGVFFSALDYAGTYGVLVLFGLLPAAMAWSERYSETTLTRVQVCCHPKIASVLLLPSKLFCARQCGCTCHLPLWQHEL